MIRAIVKDLKEDEMQVLIRCLEKLDNFFDEEQRKERRRVSYDAQKRKTQYDLCRPRHRRDRVAAGAVREPEEHGLLHRVLPA